MPRIPTYDAPQVAPTALPTPLSNNRADPEAFGEGVTKAGAQLVEGAGQVYLEAKRQADVARVQDAYSQLGDLKRSLVFDPEKGALTKQGKDAIGVADQTMQAYDKQAALIRSSLANDEQRQTFDGILRQDRDHVFGTLQAHEGQQFQVLQKDSADAAIRTSLSNAANQYTDPGAVATAQTLGEGAILVRAKQQGWPGEVTDNALRQYRSQLHGAVIDRMAETDGVAAKRYLDEHAAELDGETRIKLDKIVEGARVRDLSRQEAAAIQAKAPGDLALQLDGARVIPDTKVYDETVQRLTHDFTAQEKAKTDREQEMLGRLIQGAIQTGRLDTTSPDYTLLSDKAKAVALEKQRQLDREARVGDAEVRREQREADRQALVDFNNLDPQAAARTNLATAFPQVSSAGMLGLQAAQKKAKAVLDRGESVTFERFQSEFVDKALKDLKLEKLPAAADLRAEMTKWFLDYHDKHPGEQPPLKEATEFLKDRLLYGDAEGGSMFLSNKYKFQAERAGEQFKPLPVGDQRYAPNRVIDIPSAAAPTAPPGTVRVALPDGTTGTVPAANLSKWLAAHPGGRQL